MKKAVLLVLFGLSLKGIAQKDFCFQLSAGPNYYFNNLAIFHDNVQSLNYSFYSKIMWTTRYRLSFGIEAGYIRLYKLNDFSTSSNSEIDMYSIPVHAAIEMKLYKNFYGAFTFGPSFIRNYLQTNKVDQTTHTFSTADISFAIGYKHKFKNNLFVGAEIKHYYSSKSEDRNIAIPIVWGIYF